MAVIKVPKTPKKAFDKNRQPNGLLRAQLEHLETVVRGTPTAQAPARARLARARSRATEGDAAAHVASLMQQLQAGRAPLVPRAPAAAAPPAIVAPPRKRASRKAKKRTARKRKAAARKAR